MQTVAEPRQSERANVVRWCLGLPKVSERKLSETEIAELGAWLVHTRRNRLWSLTAVGAWVAAPGAYVVIGAPELIPKAELRVLGMASLAYLGVCILVCGIAGALWEVCAPQRSWHRTFFALAFALALLAAWLFTSGVEHAHELLLLGMVVPLFGCATFVARAIKQAQLGRRLRALQRDLETGKVEVFRGASERLGSEREQVPEGLHYESGRATLEVLPQAGLPWSSPMAGGSAIVLLSIRETERRADLPEVPFTHENASEGVDLGQRLLTLDEREELSRYARSLTRRAVIHGLVTFWFIALVVPAVARLAVPDVHSRVSFVAGCIALITGFMRGASILQHRAKVQRDAAEGLVVIVRPRAREEVETEFLPQSELEWTVARAMAPWRHRLQVKRS